MVCAAGNEPVGIDVEIIKPVDFSIAKRFFSVDEYRNLTSKEKDRQLRYFYMLWTLKESYIKAVGKGFSIPLNSFSINIESDSIQINTKNEFNLCYFRQYEIDENHIVAICTLNKKLKQVNELISLPQLLSFLLDVS